MSDTAQRAGTPTVIVTGASSGIGRATAIAFGARGYRVAINHFDWSGDAKATAAEVEAAGGTAMIAEADVSDRSAVRAMTEGVLSEFGGIDCLVNNAGIASHVPFSELPEAEWDRTIAVNLKGMFNTCQAVGNYMLSQSRGRIVNVASELAFVGAADLVHYCASKGGVLAFTKALAREFGPHGINVNAVAPGPTVTDMLTPYTDEFNEEARQQIPLRRWGTPEDIAETICFLASDSASWYAGWTLSPNGGTVMQ